MKDTRVRTCSVYIASVAACALLALAAAPSLTQLARADLPPRPTPQPTSAVPKPAPTGGLIELHVQFPEAISYQWQELWTVVQWQDEWGYWRDVAGWQGTLDSVAEGAGAKTWWVAEEDLGGGPFRWRVYRSAGGWLLVQSDEFYLPTRKGQAVAVAVTLEP